MALAASIAGQFSSQAAVFSALPPTNDAFANAMPISSLPFTHSVNNASATTEFPYDPQICYDPIRTVWYSYTAPADMNIQVNVIGSNHIVVFSIYEGTSVSNLRRIACETAGANATDPSKPISVNVPAGMQLAFQVGSDSFGCCNIVFNVFEGEGPPGAADCVDGTDNDSDGAYDASDIGCLPPPPNDNLADSEQVSLPFYRSFDTTHASVEWGEPRACNLISTTAWYSFTPSADMHISIDTFNTFFDYDWATNVDTVVTVFTGSSLTNLNYVACADDFAGLQSRVVFPAVGGTTYHVQVGDSFQNERGTIVMDIHAYDPSTDTDGDLWTDTTELGCGSDWNYARSRPERLDNADNDDYDFQVDEPLPTGAASYDCDGDGYIGSREAAIGTNDQDPCGRDGWPSDLVLGFQPNTLNIEDLGSFVVPVRRLGTSPGHPNFDGRWNLSPAPSIGAVINLSDIASATIGATGYPLMFAWQRAFGQTCHWPP